MRKYRSYFSLAKFSLVGMQWVFVCLFKLFKTTIYCIRKMAICSKMFLQKLTKSRVNFSPESFPVSVSEAEREYTPKKGLGRWERLTRELRVICPDRRALIRCSLPTWSLAWRQSGFSVLEVLAFLRVLIRKWGAAALWGIRSFLLHSPRPAPPWN